MINIPGVYRYNQHIHCSLFVFQLILHATDIGKFISLNIILMCANVYCMEDRYNDVIKAFSSVICRSTCHMSGCCCHPIQTINASWLDSQGRRT